MGKYLTRVEVIKRLQNIYGERFDFTNIDYRGCKNKIRLYCKKHGWFEQYVNVLFKGMSCQKCGVEARAEKFAYTKDDYIKKCEEIWGDIYDLSQIDYNGCYKDVTPICRKHGMFKIAAYSFLQRHGCKRCSTENIANKLRFSTDDCIEKFKEVHGDNYDYSMVDYNGMDTDVMIICPKHGVFKQKPKKHIQGHGCIFCNQSRLERDIRMLLNKYDILFEEQKTFEWLVSKRNMKLDFYLPVYNIAIECQGIQHFEVTNFNGKMSAAETEQKFVEIQYRDKLKLTQCNKNNVDIIYYSNLNINYPYKVYTNLNDVINIINERRNTVTETNTIH